MEMLKPLLAAILDEASFDLEYKETGHSGGSRRPSVERISAAELRELATRQGQQVLDRSVRVRASDQAMSGLVDALRQVLGRSIDPESDRIGHAFPVGAANSYGCHSLRGNGDLCDDGFTTPVQGFANALVQAVAKDKIGYEFNFNRHFYKYTPPRPLEEIDADLKDTEAEIMRLLREVSG